ncbi:MAG: DUF2188 domain-containing protein [Melioribacteraceae bacterium]|nr:DUF2188 domain-containing protein [Melioribacteraceae bacterium]MCF8353565.1 DUF2188 domain-containing protein [Melioribacteraceae bacterium]MCF8393488.1 DUF2188 domain-containing protein [Melioribacteraceae bacterium]MCF8419298.1 DUF2188 domain-containing protein [Melioribacteraceae bacterium]
MLKTDNYWTSPRKDGSWSVKKTGSSRVNSIHETQASAWKETRRLARGSGSEAFLQGRDGKIRARNSYGHDPFPPRG